MSEEALNKIFRALGNIEGKLDTVIETVDEHSEQISGLEKVKTQALTLVSVITFAFTFGWDWLKHKLGI